VVSLQFSVARKKEKAPLIQVVSGSRQLLQLVAKRVETKLSGLLDEPRNFENRKKPFA
jgi:hypothetical protein